MKSFGDAREVVSGSKMRWFGAGGQLYLQVMDMVAVVSRSLGRDVFTVTD